MNYLHFNLIFTSKFAFINRLFLLLSYHRNLLPDMTLVYTLGLLGKDFELGYFRDIFLFFFHIQ